MLLSFDPLPLSTFRFPFEASYHGQCKVSTDRIRYCQNQKDSQLRWRLTSDLECEIWREFFQCDYSEPIKIALSSVYSLNGSVSEMIRRGLNESRFHQRITLTCNLSIRKKRVE